MVELAHQPTHTATVVVSADADAGEDSWDSTVAGTEGGGGGGREEMDGVRAPCRIFFQCYPVMCFLQGENIYFHSERKHFIS